MGRAAARQFGHSRWGRAAWSAAATTCTSLARIAHVLFLQMTGLLFVAFAVVGGFAVAGEYRSYLAGTIGPGRGLLGLAFVLLFAWFGISSFWRANHR